MIKNLKLFFLPVAASAFLWSSVGYTNEPIDTDDTTQDLNLNEGNADSYLGYWGGYGYGYPWSYGFCGIYPDSPSCYGGYGYADYDYGIGYGYGYPYWGGRGGYWRGGRHHHRHHRHHGHRGHRGHHRRR